MNLRGGSGRQRHSRFRCGDGGLIMRRDMDLIRAIMLKLEEMPVAKGTAEVLTPGESAMAFDGYSPEQIEYHLALIAEAGLLVDHGRMMSGEFVFERLSVAGHDFVDAVRSSEIWAKTKKGAEAAGGFTVDLLKDLAKGFIKKQIKDMTGVEL